MASPSGLVPSSSSSSSSASGAGTVPQVPPNFYAQAASAQPSAKPDHSADNQKFRMAVDKLTKAFAFLTNLHPNGQDISKEIKSMAQALQEAEKKAFGGPDGEPDMDISDGGGDGQGAGAGAGGGKSSAAPGTSAGVQPMTSFPGGTGA